MDGLVAFQIHDQGTIGAPFAQRPIIHPNDPGFWRWWERLLALQSQVPILPVALKGMGELKLRKGSWFRSGKLVIHVGKIVPFDGTAEPAELARSLEETIRRL